MNEEPRSVRRLVVYDGQSPHTAAIGRGVVKALRADEERIAEIPDRRGVAGYLAEEREAILGDTPRIQPVRRDPAAYDQVIVGTHAWAYHMSPPIRTYLTAYGRLFRNMALFCITGGGDGSRALREMEELCGRRAAAVLVLTEEDVAGDHVDRLIAFLHQVCERGFVDTGIIRRGDHRSG